MADSEITVKLEPGTADRLRVGAEARGMTVEDLAAELLRQQLFGHEDYDWGGDDPRSPQNETDESGPTYALDDVLVEFRGELEKRLTSKS